MKTTKTELLKVLNLVSPALAKKESLEVMSHYIFTGTDVVAYNDKICIHHPFDIDLKEPISVKAVIFHKIVASVDSEEIEMELKDGNILFNSERSQGRFTTKAEDKEVSDRIKQVAKEFSKYEWSPLPGDFANAIHLLKFGADKDKTSAFSCIKFEGDNAYCGSGARMGWYQFEKGTLKTEPFLVDAESMADLSNFRNIQDMCITEKWVHFADAQEVIYSIRKREGEFMDVRPVFDSFSGDELKFPDTIMQDVDFASIMVNDMASAERRVEFNFNPDALIIKSEAEGGIADIVRTCENPTEVTKPIKFNINPGFFADVIGNTLGGNGKVLHSNKAIMIEVPNFKHMLALIINVNGDKV